MNNNLINETEFDILIDRMSVNDPLQAIIRGHLILESRLIKIIELCLKNKEEINVTKLRFPIKVELAYALGAIKDKSYKSILLNINTLRNKFAHDINKELKEEDVFNVYANNSHMKTLFKEENLEEDHFSVLKLLFTFVFLELDREEKRLIEESDPTSYF